jgi:hypothetical protein
MDVENSMFVLEKRININKIFAFREEKRISAFSPLEFGSAERLCKLFSCCDDLKAL